jgi:hypothetical protein
MKTPVPDTRNILSVRLSDRRDAEAWDQFVSIYEPLVYHLARAKGFKTRTLARFRRKYWWP